VVWGKNHHNFYYQLATLGHMRRPSIPPIACAPPRPFCGSPPPTPPSARTRQNNNKARTAHKHIEMIWKQVIALMDLYSPPPHFQIQIQIYLGVRLCGCVAVDANEDCERNETNRNEKRCLHTKLKEKTNWKLKTRKAHTDTHSHTLENQR